MFQILRRAHRVVEVVDEERPAQSQQQPDDQRQQSGAHRSWLHRVDRLRGLAHHRCAAGRQCGVDLELIEALLEQGLLVDEHSPLIDHLRVGRRCSAYLLVECIDLGL